MNSHAFCISIYNKVYTKKGTKKRHKKSILEHLDKRPEILCAMYSKILLEVS